MIPKSVLDRAKAFLCWDKFPELSIQLVQVQQAVAYFYPPTNQRAAIVLFYQSQHQDFKEPLFLLFHEVGHFLQFLENKKSRNVRLYRKLMDTVEGQNKVAFEQEAWEMGRDVLDEFLKYDNFHNKEIQSEYYVYSQKCIETYKKESIHPEYC